MCSLFIVAALAGQELFDNLQRLFLRHSLEHSVTCGLFQSVVGPVCHATSLWVGDLLGGGLHQWLQTRHQRQDFSWVFNELAHVVHNEAACALDLLTLVVQTPGEHWHGACQGR